MSERVPSWGELVTNFVTFIALVTGVVLLVDTAYVDHQAIQSLEKRVEKIEKAGTK